MIIIIHRLVLPKNGGFPLIYPKVLQSILRPLSERDPEFSAVPHFSTTVTDSSFPKQPPYPIVASVF